MCSVEKEWELRVRCKDEKGPSATLFRIQSFVGRTWWTLRRVWDDLRFSLSVTTENEEGGGSHSPYILTSFLWVKQLSRDGQWCLLANLLHFISLSPGASKEGCPQIFFRVLSMLLRGRNKLCNHKTCWWQPYTPLMLHHLEKAKNLSLNLNTVRYVYHQVEGRWHGHFCPGLKPLYPLGGGGVFYDLCLDTINRGRKPAFYQSFRDLQSTFDGTDCICHQTVSWEVFSPSFPLIQISKSFKNLEKWGTIVFWCKCYLCPRGGAWANGLCSGQK